LKYRAIYHQAKHIDRLIDYNVHAEGGSFIPQEALVSLLFQCFPDLYLESCGWHKVVFGNRIIDNKVVLKVGTERSIENDNRAYKRVPHNLRHQFFARIFWHTTYCLLQEYGSPVIVNDKQLDCFRRTVYKYGIFDIKADNIRSINGELKVFDANSTRIPITNDIKKD